jgi:hypothetical protein
MQVYIKIKGNCVVEPASSNTCTEHKGNKIPEQGKTNINRKGNILPTKG